ncbi:hypothetical protein BH23BAC3_BH23BAC3_01980 [soil metagenome]
MQKPNLEIMRAAIEIAEQNKNPFGAVLAMGDEIFVTAANQTKELNDPTAHAEILAIRRLAHQIKKTDLSGFTLYSTCEPCPMCMSAVIWAKIETVFFGCEIPEISHYMDQIQVRADEIRQFGFFDITVRGGILTGECHQLLEKYSR